jgi:hypothetical protein
MPMTKQQHELIADIRRFEAAEKPDQRFVRSEQRAKMKTGGAVMGAAGFHYRNQSRNHILGRENVL